MPFILQDGKLVEVTDAQFAEFGGGEAQLRTTTAAERRAQAETAAAGGQNIQVTDQQNPSNNQQIINPNTSNTSPGQELTPVAAPLNSDTDLEPVPLTNAETVPRGGFYGEPTPVGGNYTAVYDPETGNYNVVDLDTGETVETGLSQQAATVAAQDFSLGDPQFPNETDALAAAAASDVVREPTDVDVAEAAFTGQGDDLRVLNEEATPQPDEFGFVETEGGLFVQQEEIEAQIDQEQFEDALGAEELSAADIVTEPEEIRLDQQYQDEDPDTITEFTQDGPVTRTAAEAAASADQARVALLRQQATLERQRKQASDGDWRVKLRLAPDADYLYRDPELKENGILYPLAVTNGVIFPYTPLITSTYHAKYNPYDLTHSNYRGYFYQGSYAGEVQIQATFTAQDTSEANYLLAVIHFFKSATKMFYGKDAQRGAPPPLVFLQGLGEFQFNLHPCVIQQFNYNLPSDVDYIRARTNNQALTPNLLFRRDRQTLPTNPFSGALDRLRNAGLKKGALNNTPPGVPVLGSNNPTYVPTKIDMTITLLPVQTREQVSQQFSLKQFANGDLIKGGFW